MGTAAAGPRVHADDQDNAESKVQQTFAIAPVPLKLEERAARWWDWAATSWRPRDCNGCHRAAPEAEYAVGQSVLQPASGEGESGDRLGRRARLWNVPGGWSVSAHHLAKSHTGQNGAGHLHVSERDPCIAGPPAPSPLHHECKLSSRVSAAGFSGGAGTRASPARPSGTGRACDTDPRDQSGLGRPAGFLVRAR